MKKNFFVLTSFFLFFILLTPSVMAFSRSADFNYEYPFYDSANTAFVATKSATINTSADIELYCTIGSKAITGTPYVINDGVLIYGVDFIEVYDASCDKIADITLGDDLYAPVSYYDDDTTEWVFLPFDNNTLEVYTFNGTDFVFNSSHAVSNISNSYGVCDDIGGFDYCFWQNITNDLVRYTIASETVTGFAGMGGAVDTSIRAPAVRALVSGDGDVVFTGEYSTTVTKLCAWSSSTEALKASFNSGSCVTVATSGVSTHSEIHAPVIFDIDGGSSNEIGVTAAWRSGAADYKGGVFVYDGSGTLVYSEDQIVAASAIEVNIYNPLPLLVDIDGSNSQYHFCTIVESLNNRNVLCAGQTGGNYQDNLLTLCQDSNVAHKCYWIGGDFNSINGEVNETGVNIGYSEAIGEDKYVTFNHKAGQVDDLDTAFKVGSQYWASGDVNGDNILDLVTTDAGATEVYVYAAVFNNDLPYWESTPSTAVNGNNPFCVNETYTFQSLNGNNYEDDNSDSVRLFVDCYGDGRYNATSSFAAPNTGTILYAQCEWNTTGTFTANVYLQDTHQADIENISSTNLRSYNVVVSSDDEVCVTPASDSLSDSPSSTTTGDDPSTSFAGLFADFGLSGSWLFIIWLFVMLMLTFGVVKMGLTNPFVIGILNVFLLSMGWIFGVVPTSIMVIIGLLIAIIGAVAVFTGRGGG